MESFGHTYPHLYSQTCHRCCQKVHFWHDPHNLTITQYQSYHRCQDYGLHPRWRAHFLEDVLAALRLSSWRRDEYQHCWSWRRVGKTELWKCQIQDDGWQSLDTLPPPNQVKKGNFHFHEIMQTAVPRNSALFNSEMPFPQSKTHLLLLLKIKM